jgi:hypothetical protein
MIEFKEMPDEKYRLINAISYSRLKKFIQSPSKLVSDLTEEPTKAMVFGRAFHEAFLLPHLFEMNTIIKPEFSRKKEDLENKLKFEDDNKDKLIISQTDHDLITEMISRLKRVPLIKKIFANGDPESSFTWVDLTTNLPCKLRADFINQDLDMVIDLKTCISCDTQTAKREIATRLYDMQAAFYLDHISKSRNHAFKHFIIVMIEKEFPFDVKIYNLDQTFMERGRALYKKALGDFLQFKNLIDINENILDEIDFETIECPAWAKGSLE